MITNIVLNNFKCFDQAEISFSPLTLLCGQNGMGKSSVVQTILLLRQSWLHGLLDKNEIMLNGELIHLGDWHDILYEDASTDSISINVFENKKETKITIELDESKKLWKLNEQSILINRKSIVFSSRFQYLTAERTGPRLTYDRDDYSVIKEKSLGITGEYSAHFMCEYGDDKIYSDLLKHENAVSDSLKANVEAWLGEISPNIQVKYSSFTDIDRTSTRYNYVGNRSATNEYRATNVGFGISYTLPVIISLLSAQPNSIIIIENPEAHLHPRGQRKIGELIARTCSIGVQVIVETHSDHVLNGMRIIVKNKILNPEHTSFHYFDRSPSSDLVVSRITSPVIDKDGRFSNWPKGFFDEWDLALDELL